MNPVYTPDAPAAIGPYSQGVAAGNTAYISGQLPIDPTTGEFAGADIASQTRQSLKNMQAMVMPLASRIAFMLVRLWRV